MDAAAEVQEVYKTIVASVAAYGLDFIGAMFILVVGWIASGWVSGAVAKGLGKIKSCDETLRDFISSTAKYVVLCIVCVMVLEKFGVQTASLVAIVGAAGLAVGLALQGTLQNLAAGVMILAFRPFKVGDQVSVGGLSGTVRHISLFITEFLTGDGVQVISPNADLWNKAITNYSTTHLRRQDFTVSVAPERMDTVRDALLAMAGQDARILADPAPHVAVSAVKVGAVDLQLLLWSKTEDAAALKWDMAKRLPQAAAA